MPDPILSTSASRMRRSDPEIGAPAVARPRRGWRWAALPVAAGFALFGIIVWLAYKDTSRGAPIGEPPLIRAAADPIKLPPDEAEESTVTEGGVVGRLWSDAERADQPERLLPLPEQPRSPPVGAAGASTEQARQDPAQPDLPAATATPRDGAATAAGVPADASAPQPAERAALADAETALDRLLAEMTALSDEPPTSTGAARPAPGSDQAREEPPAASPPSAAAEAATSTTMGRPAPVEAVGRSEAERDVAAASAVPDASTTETPAVGQASALRSPPAPPEPAPRERSEPASAAEPAPAPAQPTRVAAIDDRFRVQVAAVREEVDARRAWGLFVADLGPVLRDVQPFFERAQTANGIFYRVQIGPFATQQAAESLCEELKQRNASCFVIRR